MREFCFREEADERNVPMYTPMSTSPLSNVANCAKIILFMSGVLYLYITSIYMCFVYLLLIN